MAFERLMSLGEEKVHRIINLLQRGEKVISIAREIQAPPPKGWGELQGMGERAVMQQLFRMRTAIAEGTFGTRLAKKMAEGRTPQVRMLEGVTVRVLDRLEELSELQRERVLALVKREKEILLPVVGHIGKDGKPIVSGMAPQEYRHLLTQTNAVFNDYKAVLLAIQKIRVDMGLDDFKGPAPGGLSMKGATQTTTYPDGTSVQKQVFEAVSTVERVFEARKIPDRVQ